MLGSQPRDAVRVAIRERGSQMPSLDELKATACSEIDRRKDDIVRIATTILHHPELGFKETETAELVKRELAKIGLPYRDGLAVTGVRADLAGASPGPTVAVLGELDSVLVSDHPLANPVTGASHSCGHNAQIASMLAVGIGLRAPGVMQALHGRVAFFAVPAEELVEVEFRLDLRRRGKVEFLGGKQEMLRLGCFDDVDLAMMVHVSSNPDDRKFAVGGTLNGFVVKHVQYRGRPAHPAVAPEEGVNALNAAMLGLMAIHAQRETFRDADTVRVHPIITRGGELVNVVPSDVRMETYVRGRTLGAIADASMKVDRAVRAGAVGTGADARISTVPGYLPLVSDPNLTAVFRANAERLVGAGEITELGHHPGSTDMGDLSQIMPVIHPLAGGAIGAGHGRDWEIVDYEAACINPAKAMAMTIIGLLGEEASSARQVLQAGTPRLTKESYLELQRGFATEADAG